MFHTLMYVSLTSNVPPPPTTQVPCVGPSHGGAAPCWSRWFPHPHQQGCVSRSQELRCLGSQWTRLTCLLQRRRSQVSQDLSAKSRGASGISHNPACPQHQGQRRDWRSPVTPLRARLWLADNNSRPFPAGWAENTKQTLDFIQIAKDNFNTIF